MIHHKRNFRKDPFGICVNQFKIVFNLIKFSFSQLGVEVRYISDAQKPEVPRWTEVNNSNIDKSYFKKEVLKQ